MDWPGQSGHLHLSLKNKDGTTAFHDPSKEHGMSDAMRWFVGGQQALMPELLAMVSPTVNSYTRMIPGFWAPTESTWGVENRTCALRVIPGSAKSQRVEYRVAAADANPYLVLASVLAGVHHGIVNKVDSGAPSEGNACDVCDPELPRGYLGLRRGTCPVTFARKPDHADSITARNDRLSSAATRTQMPESRGNVDTPA